MAQDIWAKFASQGFQDATQIERKERLIVAISGWDKSGKSRLGLTAPKPLVVFNLDRGLEHLVAEMGIAPGDVLIKNIKVPQAMVDIGADAEGGTSEKSQREVKQEALEIWSEFSTLYKMALESPDVRSVMIDTESQLWELLRLSQFGQQSAKSHHYGLPNAIYLRILKMAQASDKTVVFTRRVADKYENDKRVKGHDVKGMKLVAYEVDVNIEAVREGDVYSATVLGSGIKGEELNGLEFEGGMCDLEIMIATLLG